MLGLVTKQEGREGDRRDMQADLHVLQYCNIAILQVRGFDLKQYLLVLKNQLSHKNCKYIQALILSEFTVK